MAQQKNDITYVGIQSTKKSPWSGDWTAGNQKNPIFWSKWKIPHNIPK